MWKRKIYWNQTTGLPPPPPRDQGAAAWVNLVVGFIAGAKPWGGRESLVSDYLQLPYGTDQHAWLVNWKFLSCFASRETIRQGEISSHKSGGPVLRCSLRSLRLPQECQGPNKHKLHLQKMKHIKATVYIVHVVLSSVLRQGITLECLHFS
jgi:hypothetical protein